jgi:uncharacterized protein DUF3108
MTRRIILVVITAALLAAAGWAYYKAEQGRASLRAALAADAPPEAVHSAAVAAPAHSSAPSPELRAASPHGKAAEAKPALVPDAGPLEAGEVLEFTANVGELSKVASLKLQVASRTDFLGKPSWHLQAFAHTMNPLRIVFELDDRFDSYSDVSSLTSMQYEMHLSERGNKVDSVQRMTVTGKEPASPGASQTHVLPGTRDPLGMVQFLRTVDWSKSPEVHGPVYDGHKLYEVRARLRGAQSVTVAAGTFNASKIDIRVFDNDVEMKDAKFTLYLSTDAARNPVLLEAVMPFATARVELTKSR